VRILPTIFTGSTYIGAEKNFTIKNTRFWHGDDTVSLRRFSILMEMPDRAKRNKSPDEYSPMPPYPTVCLGVICEGVKTPIVTPSSPLLTTNITYNTDFGRLQRNNASEARIVFIAASQSGSKP